MFDDIFNQHTWLWQILMKACMVLQRRFAYIGNEIAVLLKEQHGVSTFCAYVSTRDSYDFLRTQTDIPYTHLLLDEDMHELYKKERLDLEYLNKLEEEYGLPNLWHYIENDRIVRFGQLVREYPHNTPPYTHEEMLRIVQVTAKSIIAFLDKERPDFVVYSAISGIAGVLLYNIAKKKGIRTLVIITTRINNKHIVSEHFSLFTSRPKKGNDSDRTAAKKFLSEFRTRPIPYSDIDSIELKSPYRDKNFKFLSPTRLLRAITFQYATWRLYFKREHKEDYTLIKPWHHVLDKIRRKIRILIGFDDLYDPIILGENYAFYPLQLEPELSTLLYAPFFTDQAWVAKQIARSLPVGYKLYIKEHLAMFGYRTRAFYKELKKIPNVRLIKPDIVSYSLIQNARLVVTISSTVGWEAVAFKKPVITLGDVFYNELSFVRQCTSIPQLPQIIMDQLKQFSHNEDELIEFIGSILHESVDVNLSDIWEKERSTRVNERRNELIPLASLIYSHAAGEHDRSDAVQIA